MDLTSVTLRRLRMCLKTPFTTSFGSFKEKDFILVEVRDREGVSGWGESVAFTTPWYTEETLQTNWHLLEDVLIPMLLEKPIHHPDQVSELFVSVKRNQMAKSALEGAVWDLYARRQGKPLAKVLGGEKTAIEVGISLGIQPKVQDLLHRIEESIKEGYRRIKIKIKPGWDMDILAEIRCHFPDVPLMVDANSAYQPEDLNHLKRLDEFNLMMVEQPLASENLIDHAILQQSLSTPICLDESIGSLENARQAIELGSCGIINIKIGRVGGLTPAKAIHDLCREKGIPVWCGGMLESGIGRGHNIALTTLSNFMMPGDTAASARYWDRDIICPEVTVTNGWIQVPQSPGIGYEPDQEAIDAYTLYSNTYRA
ncbi:o-succinylbenzoate synthase [Kroppenstedtia pulmonis]|uniref:o-succinylbenzoate synthase n=1 Tax=Kroppenstedtia pulmonis TaxID=1380685 RepID=A0A7D4CKI9_9BACL|nr:o-succinylbenzoate synthase [Kroppenstedtia pulmonis]QKG83518.1 o-succinylbenzoate synthase [Kroppenstedtia pulmonis]